ncbi:hypothetical protein RZA67_04690 [Stenotrophomonas sp. C3(2023)]|uniref:hypothetical protein n=1 Tax=Stenotrophomonas sp. C3(2023) TaxID=3080277 RepID=UPI00293C29A4|nr:hypothetical protein [Stenotrophomonas sp. C3(2023)]MDV3468033.1 hypothetical protein [Stenotrophomonas sp. C3(2023)]
MRSPSTLFAAAVLAASSAAIASPTTPLQIRLRILPDCRTSPAAPGCPAPAANTLTSPPQVQGLSPPASAGDDARRPTATW